MVNVFLPFRFFSVNICKSFQLYNLNKESTVLGASEKFTVELRRDGVQKSVLKLGDLAVL